MHFVVVPSEAIFVLLQKLYNSIYELFRNLGTYISWPFDKAISFIYLFKRILGPHFGRRPHMIFLEPQRFVIVDAI